VIGRLACARLEDPGAAREEAELRWALDNVFGLPELRALVADHPDAFAELSGKLPDPLARAVPLLARGEEVPASLEDELDAGFEARSSALRRADRGYWRSIIEELRVMRREGRLMPEGAAV
jgi:hypothetical protein